METGGDGRWRAFGLLCAKNPGVGVRLTDSVLRLVLGLVSGVHCSKNKVRES